MKDNRHLVIGLGAGNCGRYRDFYAVGVGGKPSGSGISFWDFGEEKDSA